MLLIPLVELIVGPMTEWPRVILGFLFDFPHHAPVSDPLLPSCRVTVCHVHWQSNWSACAITVPRTK